MKNFSFHRMFCRRMGALLLALSALTAYSAHAAIPIHTWKTANGVKVLFVENHSIPVIDVSVEFDAGSRRDPQGKSGLASLTNAMLARGISAAEDRQPEPALAEAQILDAFADAAAQRGGSAGLDRAGVTLRTLSSPAERDAAILLLARVIAQPSFPENFLARDRTRAIAALREELTKPEAIASRAFMQALYGNHPYGVQPTPESLASITRDDVAAFHRTHYVANGAVIAIVGDATRKEAEAIADQLTVRMNVGEREPLPTLPTVPAAVASERRIVHPAAQSHIMIGTPALKRGDPDFYALTVGNYVLGGGGFVSRLMQEVREKRGLAYSVHSHFSPLAQTGPFQVGLQTQKSQSGEAIDVVRAGLADFLKSGPTEAEMKAAKDNLINSFALRIDTNRKLLEQVAVIGYYDLPLDYLDTWTQRINQVRRSDVAAAFGRKLNADSLATVVVGASD